MYIWVNREKNTLNVICANGGGDHSTKLSVRVSYTYIRLASNRAIEMNNNYNKIIWDVNNDVDDHGNGFVCVCRVVSRLSSFHLQVNAGNSKLYLFYDIISIGFRMKNAPICVCACVKRMFKTICGCVPIVECWKAFHRASNVCSS